MARIVQADRWVPVGLWVPCGLVLAGCALAPYLPAGFGFVAVTVVPFALLIGAAASADRAHARTPWRSPPVVLLGELSFAFYLLHQIVIRGIDQGALGHRTWPAVPGFAIAAAMLLVALVGSWLLHKTVERPSVRLLATRPKREPEADVRGTDTGEVPELSPGPRELTAPAEDRSMMVSVPTAGPVGA